MLALLLVATGVSLLTSQIGFAEPSFRSEQQRHPRVRAARSNTAENLAQLFRRAELPNPPARIFIRAFKRERELEVWGAPSDSQAYRLIKTYLFTGFSGALGPKRAQGDRQIPEGVYFIDRFNPNSRFHLSLGLDYPNRSDRLRKKRPDPGGDIFIHGSWVTIGCIPLGDRSVEELYVMAVDARSAGQKRIPVHIFPCRLRREANQTVLRDLGRMLPPLDTLWQELLPIYDAFAETRRVPDVRIDPQGRYHLGAASE